MPTLQQILGGRNLTKVVQGVRPGLPEETVPPALVNGAGIRETVQGDQAEATRIEGTRRTATQVAYGSPSKALSMKGVSKVPVKLIHTFNNTQIKATTIVNLEDTDGNKQSLGQAEVARQTGEIRQILDNTRMMSLFSVFGTGAVHFDGDGNILESTSGAAFSASMQIPASNTGTLLDIAGNAIIDASWAAAGTKIITHVKLIKRTARQRSGYRLKHAFYGANILDYLLTNNQIKEFLHRKPSMQETIESGEIPNGFLGLNWWPADEWFYEKHDGTLKEVFPADQVTFLPDPEGTWFRWLEGTFPVPSALNVSSDLVGAMGSLTPTPGRFSYASIELDPPSGKQYYGDTQLPWIAVPGSVFLTDTTP